MSAQLHSLCQEVDHDYNVALAKEAKEMSESKLQQPEKQARAPPSSSSSSISSPVSQYELEL